MQKIFLETNDKKLINSVENSFPEYPVVQVSRENKLSRFEHLREASYGSVFYSDQNPNTETPMSFGFGKPSVSAIKTSLDYSKLRVSLVNEEELFTKYVGGVEVLPRDLILLANTKNWEEDVESILNIVPDTGWTTIGFIAVNSSAKLSELYSDVFSYSTFLSGDSSSKSKLIYAGIEFVDISHLDRDEDAGRWIRELTRRPEVWEVSEVDLEFKREG